MKEQKIQIIVITVAIVIVVAVTAIAMNMINTSVVTPGTKTRTNTNTVAASNMGVNINYAINAIVNERLEPKLNGGEIKSYTVVYAEELIGSKECSAYKDSNYQVEVEIRYVKEKAENVIFPGSETVSTENALETVAKVNFVMKDRSDGESGYTIVDNFTTCDQ